MQVIKIMAVSLALAAYAAVGAVDYVLDGTNDKVNASTITWPGIASNYCIIGTAAGRASYQYLPTLVQGYISGFFVSKINPDWIGPAVSNLYMGDRNIYNVSNLTFRSLITYDGGSSQNFFTNSVASLGSNVDGTRMQHAWANSTLFLGYNTGLSRQEAYYGYGNIMGGFANKVRQTAGALGSTPTCAYGTVSWIGDSLHGAQLNYGRANLNWAGFLTYATQSMHTSSIGCMNWGGSMNTGGYQVMLPGAVGSWNVGGNNVNSNPYSYVFGTGMVSHLGDEIVAPTVWLGSTPTHPMHAVPKWWVTNEIGQATNYFVTTIFPGLAASAAEVRNGVLHGKFVAPDTLTNIIKAYGAGGDNCGVGGYIELSAGSNTYTSPNPAVAIPGRGGIINLKGGNTVNQPSTTIAAGNGGSINLSGANSEGGARSVAGGDGGSISLKGYGHHIAAGGGSITSDGGADGAGGSILMSSGGGSIDTTTGTVELGTPAARITLVKSVGHTNITVTLPVEAGTLALITDIVRNHEAKSATAIESRNGTLSNKYVNPASLTNIIYAAHRDRSGGSINIAGGTDDGGGGAAGLGGVIDMSGGYSEDGFNAGNSGNIATKGGNGGPNTVAGGNGGSIDTRGSDGTPGGAKAGGYIYTYGGSSGAGGSINTANGGGSLNTAAGVGALNPFLAIGQSTMPTDVNGGQYRLQFHKLGNGNVYFQQPAMVMGGSTGMYTVAQVELNMNSKRIVNVLNATNGQDVPSLSQVQTLMNTYLFQGATPAEVRIGTNGAPKGVTPASLAGTGTGSTYPILLCNNGIAGTALGGLGGTIRTYGGAGGATNAVGGNGGNVNVYGGAGGSGVSANGFAGAGGTGGVLSLVGGLGGDTDTSKLGGGMGGVGGTITANGGVGGNAAADGTGGNGGAGGAVVLNGGNGLSAQVGLAKKGGNSGGINLSGGNAVSGSEGGAGGNITATGNGAYSGGSVDTTAGVGGNGGSINLLGGYAAAGTITSTGGYAAGSTGGSLNMSGGAVPGGSIDTHSGSATGGFINTSEGGGNVDTINGYIGLGPEASRTTISKQGVAPGVGKTLYVPGSMSGNIGTIMTTVAMSTLDMNQNKIVGLPALTYPPTAADSGSAVNYAQITNLLYTMSLQTTPIGSIQAYGGETNTIPDGWLLCDGVSVLRGSTMADTYYRLFLAIGTAWGTSDGSLRFNLPDLRGRFTRGVSYTAGTDPDVAGRTAVKLNGNTGNSVGSFQGESITNHVHAPTITHTYLSSPGNECLNRYGTGNGSVYGLEPVAVTSTSVLQHVVTGGDTGGSETRPQNVYVNYIIRYR